MNLRFFKFVVPVLALTIRPVWLCRHGTGPRVPAAITVPVSRV